MAEQFEDPGGQGREDALPARRIGMGSASLFILRADAKRKYAFHAYGNLLLTQHADGA